MIKNDNKNENTSEIYRNENLLKIQFHKSS